MPNEKYSAEQEDRRSDGLFRAVIDASPHGVMLCSNGRTIYTNQACERLLPFLNREATESQPGGRYVHTARYEVTYDEKPIEVTVAQDVTERRRLETRIEGAQRLEALGRWVGGVAHDFNNLLTAVMLYSDLVATAVGPESPATKYNEEIRTAAKRGAELVGQLLALGRESRTEPAILSLNALLSGIRDMLQRMTGEDVELIFDLAPGPCDVKVDLAQVQQAIFNLALNARDAMPEGGTLMFKTAEDKDKSDAAIVKLTVEDTGCGMSPETVRRACEPFFSTKSKGKGTGLGLTMVERMAVQAGGSLVIDSELGKGTRVGLTLPRAQSVTCEMPAAKVKDGMPRGSETILVVEDDTAVRTAVCAFLSECGYKVLEARGGPEALRVAESSESPIQLLICDLVLPGMGGRQLAARLQTVVAGLSTIFISGYGEYAPSTVAGKGAVDVFQKPFNRAELAAKVREALEQKRLK